MQEDSFALASGVSKVSDVVGENPQLQPIMPLRAERL